MADLRINYLNAAWLVLEGDPGVIEDLYEYFKLEDPDFKPNRFSRYDGKIRLFDKRTGKFPYGLLHVALEMATARRWTTEIDPELHKDFRDVPMTDIVPWVQGLQIHSQGKPIEPYDYQYEGLRIAANYNRATMLAATSAGKSLLQYLIVRFYHQAGLNILMVVPSINLVSQMYNDFRDYSSVNRWDVAANVHTIYEGATPYTNKPVVISTWQSLKDLPEEWFHRFDVLLGDECHTFSSKCLDYIGKACINARMRYGLTGTLRKGKNHPLQVQQHFGPCIQLVTTKELQDSGRAAKTQVHMLHIDHSPQDRQERANCGEYQREIDFLLANDFRNNLIKGLAHTTKGNTLILFERRAHLDMIKEQLEADGCTKLVRVIDGSVENADRDVIKAEMEAAQNGQEMVLLATGGCVSTGVSIKNLHNLVFTFPSKSLIKVVQSIGRTIRLHDSKEVANIYDILDDLSYAGSVNHTLRHAAERLAIYEDEGHPVKVVQFSTHKKLSVTTKVTKILQ